MAKAANQWPVQALEPAKLSSQTWGVTGVLGAIFIIMAATQLISFSEFKNDLDAMGVASAAVWGTVLMVAELWAAAGLFKLKLSWLFRVFSSVLAVLVSGFWFYETIRLVSANLTSSSTHLGLFGKYLVQSPSWWTVLETTVVLFVTLWAIDTTKVK